MPPHVSHKPISQFLKNLINKNKLSHVLICRFYASIDNNSIFCYSLLCLAGSKFYNEKGVNNMNIKTPYNAICLILTICMLFLWGCVQMLPRTEKGHNLTVNDIAYDVNKKSGHIVYINEYDKYVPYLVLTNNYNENVLLLRKHLLFETLHIKNVNWEGSGGSYYPDSDVDFFLNEEYLSGFTQSVQDIISETEIIVTTKESLQKGGGFSETEKIKRKIFILSSTELGIKSGMANTEGKTLKYFKDTNNLLTTDENGKPQVYWTRTPYLVDDIKTWTVSYDGTWGSSPVALKQAIRPAFCVGRNITIKERSDIINNETVYTLD